MRAQCMTITTQVHNEPIIKIMSHVSVLLVDCERATIIMKPLHNQKLQISRT